MNVCDKSNKVILNKPLFYQMHSLNALIIINLPNKVKSQKYYLPPHYLVLEQM